MIPVKRLMLSGGGIKVISSVGALRVLEERGSLRNIKEIGGISAGAWLAFMMSMGLTIQKIEKLVLDLEFSVIRNITPDALIGFPETFGLDDGTNLRKFLESIFRIVIKVDPGLTFSEISSRPIQFRCWATDLNTYKIREFSSLKTPSVKIIEALHASMALPFYFIPVIDSLTGHLLTDGGLQGSHPIFHLTDEECEESMSIGFNRDSIRDEDAPSSMMGFVNAIFSSILESRNKNLIRKWGHRILQIPVDDFSSWNFEVSREDRALLVKKGSEAATIWLKKWLHNSRVVSRRMSI